MWNCIFVCHLSVHPHVLGEQPCMPSQNTSRNGSSPRTWGTDCNPRPPRACDRFIPTYVGKSAGELLGIDDVPVHPHVREEQVRRLCLPLHLLGSSPRTWGTAACASVSGSPRRFIPTYVGNSLLAGKSRCSVSVHPHVRGEQLIHCSGTDARGGSSPRTRGTGGVDILLVEADRFIPTYVGNRLSHLSSQWR